jgi:hypothetical protein
VPGKCVLGKAYHSSRSNNFLIAEGNEVSILSNESTLYAPVEKCLTLLI